MGWRPGFQSLAEQRPWRALHLCPRGDSEIRGFVGQPTQNVRFTKRLKSTTVNAAFAVFARRLSQRFGYAKRTMHTLGRSLQLFGLIIVPMALLYYVSNRGQASEAKLMFGELSILLLGAVTFLLGRSLAKS